MRSELRARRKSLTSSQRRLAARKAARAALRVVGRQRRIALYLAAGSEISTQPLLRALLKRGLRLHLPRLHRGTMQFVPVTATTPLREKAHGLREPVGARHCPVRRLDLVFMPLVGFDHQGQRLGAGGGYYDRALARRLRRPLRVGYAYALQRCPPLPHDPWDVPLHAVVTEQGVWRWPTG